MKIYPPSILPVHIITSNPIKHWNIFPKLRKHQSFYNNIPIEFKIIFIKILLNKLNRKFEIINDEYIYDYGNISNNNNHTIYEKDENYNKRILKVRKKCIPCIIGDNIVLSADKNKYHQISLSSYSFPGFLNFCYLHADRIQKHTFELRFKCALQ